MGLLLFYTNGRPKVCTSFYIVTIDFWSTLCYNIDTVRETLQVTGQAEKGGNMEEGMTNEQFNKVLKMIIQIIKDSTDKQDAIKKIEALLNNE